MKKNSSGQQMSSGPQSQGEKTPSHPFTRKLKRLLDIVLSLLLFLGLLPLMLLAAILIKLTSRGPIFFITDRIGKDGIRFRFYKFRTMKVGAEKERQEMEAKNSFPGDITFKDPNDSRVNTLVGHFLRKFSIDELPQLVNVLKNDMSLVGPRPGLPEEVAQYDETARRRLSVMPGLSGLWQVSGRRDLPFKEQIRLDLEYIDNWSLWLDIKILFRTIIAVLSTKGAY